MGTRKSASRAITLAFTVTVIAAGVSAGQGRGSYSLRMTIPLDPQGQWEIAPVWHLPGDTEYTPEPALADADDPEDGILPVKWSSSIDGLLGSPDSFRGSRGKHVLTASATDAGGLTGSKSVTIYIGVSPPWKIAYLPWAHRGIRSDFPAR